MYLAYQALRYVGPLALTPFLAHALKNTAFADLVILNSCIWTSTVFMEFGFYLYGISKTAAARDKEDLSRIVTAITLGKVLLAPISLAAYLSLAAWSGLLFHHSLIVVIGSFSAIGYGASFAWFFQGQERGGAAVMMEGIPQFAYYALVFILVRTPGDLPIAAAIQAVPPLASVIVAFLVIWRNGLFGGFDFRAARTALSEAFPYFVERFCFSLYTAITPTMIAVLSATSEATYYSIGDKVGIFLGTAMTPFFQAALPRVSRAAGKAGGGWRLSITLVGFCTLTVGILATVMYLSAGIVIGRLFSADYLPAVKIAKLFCITSTISVFGMALANFVIIPRNASRIMIWSSCLGLAAGLIAQCILVPHYGAAGGVLSRGLSESIVALVLAANTVQLFSRRSSLGPIRRKPSITAITGLAVEGPTGD